MFLKLAQGIEAAGEMLLRVGCAAILGSPAVTLLEEAPLPEQAPPDTQTEAAPVH